MDLRKQYNALLDPHCTSTGVHEDAASELALEVGSYRRTVTAFAKLLERGRGQDDEPP